MSRRVSTCISTGGSDVGEPIRPDIGVPATSVSMSLRSKFIDVIGRKPSAARTAAGRPTPSTISETPGWSR
jgi:hypothetical protein